MVQAPYWHLYLKVSTYTIQDRNKKTNTDLLTKQNTGHHTPTLNIESHDSPVMQKEKEIKTQNAGYVLASGVLFYADKALL